MGDPSNWKRVVRIELEETMEDGCYSWGARVFWEGTGKTEELHLNEDELPYPCTPGKVLAVVGEQIDAGFATAGWESFTEDRPLENPVRWLVVKDRNGGKVHGFETEQEFHAVHVQLRTDDFEAASKVEITEDLTSARYTFRDGSVTECGTPLGIAKINRRE